MQPVGTRTVERLIAWQLVVAVVLVVVLLAHAHQDGTAWSLLLHGAVCALVITGLVTGRTLLDRARRDARAMADEATRALVHITEREEQIDAIVEHSRDLLCVVDARGMVLYASPGFAPTLGYAPETLVGTRVSRLVHAEDFPRALEQMRALFDLGSARASFRAVHADGSVRHLDADGTRIRRDGNDRLVVVARDVTAQRELEARLHRTERMETMARLATGVAHDFNNVLTAMMSHASVAAREVPRDSPAHADLIELQRAGERATVLVRQLLSFGRRQEVDACDVDANDLVAGLEPLLRRLIGERVTLVTELGDAPGVVRAGAGQVEQVVVNLAVNARDAMPAGGTLTVRTRRDDGGACAVIEVADTGEGMTGEVRAHAFEPFFTTKEPGRGTGLGLASCHGIVSRLGGTITIESAPGAGTTVRVAVPCHDDAPAHDR